MCHGKPIFRGTRIFVSDVLEPIVSITAWETIIEEWHDSITEKGAKMPRYQRIGSVRLQTTIKAEDLSRQIDAMQTTFFTTEPGERGNIPGDISMIPRPKGKPAGYIDLPSPKNYHRLEIFFSNEADDDMRAKFEALIRQLLERL